MQLILERKGYATTTAHSGREALQAMRTGHYDVALLDIRLPDLEGTDLLIPMKNAHPELAAIMLTANASVESAVRALNHGAAAYLLKPVNMDELLAVLRSCVEKQRLLRQNRELYQRAEQARRELEDATAQRMHQGKLIALGELTAAVAHELNQPLNSLKLTCQAALRYFDPYDPEAVIDDLKEMLTMIQQMAQIIDDMRVFSSRIDTAERRPIDLNDLVRAALRFTEAQLRNHGIRVIRELGDGLPRIGGQGPKLQQVIMNLLSNARHALETCTRDDKRVTLRTFARGESVICEIEDNGVGIPPNLLQEVFLPFVTTRRPSQGTGLGLSIAHKIIDEHDGRLEAESELGKGTVLRLALPALTEAEGGER